MLRQPLGKAIAGLLGVCLAWAGPAMAHSVGSKALAPVALRPGVSSEIGTLLFRLPASGSLLPSLQELGRLCLEGNSPDRKDAMAALLQALSESGAEQDLAAAGLPQAAAARLAQAAAQARREALAQPAWAQAIELLHAQVASAQAGAEAPSSLDLGRVERALKLLDLPLGQSKYPHFSPDSGLLLVLTGSPEHPQRLFDLNQARELDHLLGPRTREAVLSANGQRLLVQDGGDLSLSVLKLPEQTREHSPLGRPELIDVYDYRFAFLKFGEHRKVFDLDQGVELPFWLDRSMSYSESPHDRPAIVDYREGRVYDLKARQWLPVPRQLLETAEKIALLAQGRWLRLSYRDRVEIYDAATMKSPLEGLLARSAEVSPDGRLLAYVTHDGAVLVSDLETGERRLLDGKAKGSRVSFVAGGRLLEIILPANERFNPSYRYHDTRDWEELGALLGSQPLLYPEQGGPRQFASSNKGSGVRLFDLDRRKALDELTGPDLQGGLLSPDASVAVVRPADEPARIIDLAAGKALALSLGLSDSRVSFSFSPDSRLILASPLEGRARLIDYRALNDDRRIGDLLRDRRNPWPILGELSSLLASGVIRRVSDLGADPATSLLRGLLGLYKQGKRRLELSSLAFEDGGDAVTNYPEFLRDLLAHAPPVNFERPEGLPSLDRLPSLAGAPVYSSLEDISGGGESPRAYGRTLVFRRGGKALHVKFLKAKEYPGVLAYEHDLMDFLRERQEAWGLKGHYPKGIARLGRLPADQAPAGISLPLDRQDGWLTFMAYEVDLVEGQNPYTTYLNDPGIEPKDFLRAFMVNVHDRFAMARRGLFDLEIIELFHSKEHERRYDWMVDVHPVHHARRGAGRLNDVVGATLYPNVRLSGPADLAGLVHIDDLLMEDALPDHANGRVWRLLDINERDPDLARPSLLAALLGDTLLSLSLIPPTYLERRGSLNWRSEKTRGRTLLQESLKVLFRSSFNAYCGPSLPPYGRDFLDIPLMAAQMAYFMTTDYMGDLLGKKIPEELFPGSAIRYGQIESSRGWTPRGWDIMAVRHRLPIAGSPNRGSQDLGPVNGPLPLQALVRGLYIAATAMTARIGAPSSRDLVAPSR